MKKVLIVYDTFTGHTRTMAEKIKKRFEDIGMSVDLFRDKKFKNFSSVRDYDVIALGAPCHGGQPALTLKRKLKEVLTMDLKGKKLITFASAADPKYPSQTCQKIEGFMKSSGITPVTSIGCVGKPRENFDSTLEASIQENLF